MVALAVLSTACGRLEPLSTQEALERLNVATTKIYASDGSLIANLHGEINRDIVPLDRVPRHARDAVIAIEDERFWTHKGVDLRSITRAALSNLNDDDDRLQGGSTISQQLAKNLYFPNPERTLSRKVSEARVTLQLEQQYTKRDILEMYLNTIYLGRGVYGLQTAARSYFRVDASDLSLAQAAFLAGVIHEPGRYQFSPSDPPDRRQERAEAGIRRRNTVLSRMLTLGVIEPEDADAASEEPLEVFPPSETKWQYPYFVDMVLRQLGVLRNSRSDTLDERYSFLGDTFDERSQNVYRGGLRVYTTLDPRVQDAAERSVREMLPADLSRLSAALTAIEPGTGYVRAVVGGRDYYPSCEDDAASSHTCKLAKVNLALGDYGGGSGRQTGSAFKTVALATALERGVSLQSSFSGAQFTHPIPLSEAWRVNNYEGSGGGAVNLVEATVRSVNAAYARLVIFGIGEGDALKGAERVADMARRMGIPFATPEALRIACGDDYLKVGSCTPADVVPATTLGAKEVSTLDLASAYGTIANDGIWVEPTAIVRITDATGRTIYEANPRRQRAMSPAVASGISHVLQQVIERGTATGARIDREAAAKTGTSQQWRDALLAGYVPQLAAVVWVGNPIPVQRSDGGFEVESMHPSNGYPRRVTGGSYPADIWRAFMTRALEGVPVERFEQPPSSLFVPDSAQLPEGSVPDVLGLPAGEATQVLQGAGFDVTESRCISDLGVGGIVVKQTPSPGVALPEGSPVDICLSFEQGPVRPPSESDDEMGVVPDVVGESRARANTAINGAGFEREDHKECDPSGATGAGVVWKQDPVGGTNAPAGSTVHVWYNGAGC